MSISLKRVFQLGKLLLPIIILIIVFIQARKELADLSFRQAVHVIKNMPTGGFILALIVGTVAVATMFLYDYVLVHSLSLKISIPKVFRISWIANSFNGVLGFGGLAGAGLRTMLYRQYTKDSSGLVKGVAWLTSAFITGLSVLSFLTLLHILDATYILQEKPWLWPPLICFALFVPLYIGISKRKAPSRPTVLYSLVSCFEWLSAGVVIYVILCLLDVNISFPETLGVFVIAAIAGSISLVPGGLGSFDLIFLTGIERYGVETETAFSALLLYRLVYYFFPFGLGLIFAAFEMSGAALKKIEDKPFIAPALETTGVIWTLQRDWFSKLGHWAIAALTAISGLLVILSVLVPTSVHRVHALRILVQNQVIDLSFGLALSFGILLLILSGGIYRRTKRAYYMAVFVLIGGIISNALKGIDLEESLILLIVLTVLFMLRKLFVRQLVKLTFSDIIKITLVITGALVLYLWIGILFVDMDEVFEPYYVVRTIKQVQQSTMIASIVVPVYLLISSIALNRFLHKVPGSLPNFQRLELFLKEYGGNALSHLGFLGDKRFFFSKDGTAMLQFARSGKWLVVLGDPIGNPSSFQQLMGDFLREADYAGFICVFYQIESKFLALYHDFGYNFFKLGEEAIVDLNTFTLSGKKRSSLRTTFNRFQREEYSFHVYSPPFSNEFLLQLKQVSDSWIGKKKEKGFSLGYFDSYYINRAPVAVLRNKEGQIGAFVTLMPAYRDCYISVDLMRHHQKAPSGIMDAMFIHLFHWAKQEGYRFFNIGMAPLSNVGISPHSFWSEKVAAAIFNNVRYTYSFSGLRSFKDKYKPNWSGKYLAFQKNHSLPATMLSLTKLISKAPLNK
ncbi:bifunctional lysylphosphatidylglycerol flippase/synthetase MprF [Bacillus sp. 165]|uniref:bifunctional lysylphosphatidylglycerol flippase/synthetase MprF n=1 Tax=Bacillus sp. 165 TaxID=1529117 RepID=UPI001ADD5417|nr:bifunctional lysylphosphatidylglycerol flippase/synthetase MprF [Bacillus sp. 165]MBO9128304.1 bifunctional lysylphosphatidylglycerol flippase/synthetase MprF [Bacillus sp. 165]